MPTGCSHPRPSRSAGAPSRSYFWRWIGSWGPRCSLLLVVSYLFWLWKLPFFDPSSAVLALMQGWVIIRDASVLIEAARSMAMRLKWDARRVEIDINSDDSLLICQKPFLKKPASADHWKPSPARRGAARRGAARACCMNTIQHPFKAYLGGIHRSLGFNCCE